MTTENKTAIVTGASSGKHGPGTGAARSRRGAPGLETAPMRPGPATGGLWI